MHFNSCNIHDVCLSFAETNPIPLPQLNREDTSLWQTNNTEYRTVTFSGGTTISAENKLQNDKRKQKQNKKLEGVNRE